jgi:hypothetical protein
VAERPEATAASQSAEETAPVPSVSSAGPAVPQPVEQSEPSAGRMLRILPLGCGLVLFGLGLGLAFIALRVRRSQ